MTQMPTALALSGEAIAVIVAVAVLVPIFWFVIVQRGLVRLRQSCKESWADIDTELERRHDLIPNLIETVKGYAAHEKSVLEEVTNLRNQAVASKGKSPAERSKVEDQLGKAATGLFARFEAYPDLKANENFLNLQNQLGETETRIARARRFYNANIRDFMNGVQMFPNSIVAGMGGFRADEFKLFEADESAREAVKVDFGS